MGQMTDKPVAEMSFEDAMAALEQVVSQLEKGEVALDASIALYERGAALKAHCAGKLKDAEEKVELIRAQEGRAIGTTPAEGF
jgi:exodeoxyribonuclease VII small subunit